MGQAKRSAIWPVAAAGVIWLDKTHSQAGLIVLLALVSSLGAVHGALDAVLMVRQFKCAAARIKAGLLYLAASTVTALALYTQPEFALLVLLLLSVWHFGESFDGTRYKSAAYEILQRLVRGGAPVLIPALTSRHALKPIVLAAVSNLSNDGNSSTNDSAAGALAWVGWSSMAAVWVGLVLVWLAIWAKHRIQALHHSRNHGQAANYSAAQNRQTVFEITALLALYALTSPLMAFALFFGLHHAVGHIRRVMVLTPSGAHHKPLHRDPMVISTLVLTLVMGMLLIELMVTLQPNASLQNFALRSVVLALTAVSVPHVWLITCWVKSLR
jgi:beta-carotene 15,15'-dioxygenase